MKRIPKEKAFKDMNIVNECKLMRKLGRSENILSYYGMYTSKSNYHIVTEYMEGKDFFFF